MDADRIALYDRLESSVVDTPLVMLHLGNGNDILVKEEYATGTGSHYDRVYVHLLREMERDGTIVPGVTPLVETTCGSAGEAFAWVCQEAGYDALVVLPENSPVLKVESMRRYGAELRFTPVNQGVPGAANELRTILKVENSARDVVGKPKYFCPNHSRDIRTLDALERIAVEVMEEVMVPIDFFITAFGNGSSVLGPGRYVKETSPGTRIVGWEPIESGFSFEMRFPGKYKELFGIEPGRLKHELFGTGPGHEGMSFPFLEQALIGEKSVIDLLTMVASQDSRKKLERLTSDTQALENVMIFPKWSDINLRDFQGGPTTLASIAVAKDFVDNHNLRNQLFLVIGYDLGSKHL